MQVCLEQKFAFSPAMAPKCVSLECIVGMRKDSPLHAHFDS